MAKAAFIGLGVMGYPMAGHLKAAGHDVTVYNRTTAKAEAWVSQHGGSMAATPAEAAKGAEFVFACVGADDDLRAVTTGPEGAFAAMDEGSIFIDNTTASAGVARELHAAASAAGLGFIDAPVSGGQAGAEGGILTVMCGGDEADFTRAEPVIGSFGRIVNRIGGPGAGQQAKMVNQICIAGLVQGLSEAINFGIKAGLDMDVVLDTIGGGAAQSWQMVNRGKTMVADEFDFGFAVDWMIKDLGICMEEAARANAPLPVTEQVLGYYREVSANGGGRWDTSSLIRRLG
ncbi:MAG: 2-hydroxy-3-oxopropionate reductase [SAR116 cluster bacterium MED-G04]|nr:MAG: 2-hydroxy-3-oxopropionate reductase [SAR116 cluster bacterium MED-G04]CAI8428056.1 MAG: 2-hydroxy-3-oxopropionate reductase [SAR116 cluster bacterium MED-G04]|tara:strand:- start:4309 stop:5172 length:864 start_codon:yes stop_codon:yes gene_type:complete